MSKQRKKISITVGHILIVILILIGGFCFYYAGTSKLDSREKLNNVGVDEKPSSPVDGLMSKTAADVSDMKLNVKVTYPIHSDPTVGTYPSYSSLLSIISGWNPDNPDPPSEFKETLQHFNYTNPEEMILAKTYRDLELPFKVYNVPEFNSVTSKWDDDYLQAMLYGNGQSKHIEKSKDNHFMYWNGAAKGIRQYTPPTEFVDNMQFDAWLRIAKRADVVKVKNETVHYYFMANANAGDRRMSFIGRDLTLFSSRKENFFMQNIAAGKGIQCRFGMRGIIAEAHYDSGRNMVAMLKGAKRYIINPPSACKKLGIITDVKHPSYRHSVIDWSDINQATSSGFDSVEAIDTIVQTGKG